MMENIHRGLFIFVNYYGQKITRYQAYFFVFEQLFGAHLWFPTLPKISKLPAERASKQVRIKTAATFMSKTVFSPNCGTLNEPGAHINVATLFLICPLRHMSSVENTAPPFCMAVLLVLFSNNFTITIGINVQRLCNVKTISGIKTVVCVERERTIGERGHNLQDNKTTMQVRTHCAIRVS